MKLMWERSFFMSKDTKFSWKPSKQTWIAAVCIVSIFLILWLIFGRGLGIGGSKNVEFNSIAKDKIPKAIETEVIPEYRELERALGCLVDGKVYVLVTRGEKPTSGYKVSIEKMTLETKDGKTNFECVEIKGKPTAIIANTIKGKGVSFMENEVGWHGKAPNQEEYETAMKELTRVEI